MRQIELYKRDPTVGLVPPDSTLTRFVKSKFDQVLAYGGPIYILGTEALKTSPPSRFTIYAITFAMAMLVLNIVLAMLLRMQTRFHERLMAVLALTERNTSITEKIVDTIRSPKEPGA